jgi:hypothetical protein
MRRGAFERGVQTDAQRIRRGTPSRVPPLKPREFSKIVHPASGWCVLKQLEAVTDLT